MKQGRPIYGYRVCNGIPVIHEPEAKVVRAILGAPRRKCNIAARSAGLSGISCLSVKFIIIHINKHRKDYEIGRIRKNMPANPMMAIKPDLYVIPPVTSIIEIGQEVSCS
jgi:hypothetical protein